MGLSMWWVHPVTITLPGGHGPYGPTLGEVLRVVGWASARSTITRDMSTIRRDMGGREIISDGTVSLPLEVGHIPEGAVVQVPDVFGTKRMLVTSCEVSTGGGLPTPDHITLTLSESTHAG